MAKTLLFINGSPEGEKGNCAKLPGVIRPFLPDSLSLKEVNLKNTAKEETITALEQADAFFFATGTYWDSWGSPLQKLFEDLTEYEVTDLWLGKPAGAVVLMHSVGGKGVLSRLQGVLSSLGVLLPPCSAMVYSTVNKLALVHQSESPEAKDLWRLSDLKIICHNLNEACQNTLNWKTWPVAKDLNPQDLWI